MAEDLSQETWMKVIQHASSFQARHDETGQVKAQVSTWILRIAKNLTLNEIKKRKWEDLGSSEVIEKTEDPDSDIEALLSGAEDRARLKDAIEKLPEQSRVVLTLWMSGETNHSEIAEDLGLTVSHVKVLLFRAKKSLQSALGVRA